MRHCVMMAAMCGAMTIISGSRISLAQPPPSPKRWMLRVAQYQAGAIEPRALFEGLQKKFGPSAVFESDAFFSQEHCDEDIDCDIVTVKLDSLHDYSMIIRNDGSVRTHERLIRPWHCNDTTPDDQCDHSALYSNIGTVIEHLVGCHQNHETAKCQKLQQQ